MKIALTMIKKLQIVSTIFKKATAKPVVILLENVKLAMQILFARDLCYTYTVHFVIR